MKTNEFIDYVQSFFQRYASGQRGLSTNTISSYSDGILLFFRFSFWFFFFDFFD